MPRAKRLPNLQRHDFGTVGLGVSKSFCGMWIRIVIGVVLDKATPRGMALDKSWMDQGGYSANNATKTSANY